MSLDDHHMGDADTNEQHSVLMIIEDDAVFDDQGERFIRVCGIAVTQDQEREQIHRAVPDLIFVQRGLTPDVALQLADDLSVDLQYMPRKQLTDFIRRTFADILAD